MSGSIHEQARELIALAGHQDLSSVQRTWMQDHLQECAPCSNYAEAVGRTARQLRCEAFAADSALVQATKMRVRSRAHELQQQQERMWLVGGVCIFVGISAAITTPLFWQAFAWMGIRAGVSDWVWQAVFLSVWIAPAFVVSALLLARGTQLTSNREEQGT